VVVVGVPGWARLLADPGSLSLEDVGVPWRFRGF